MYCNKFKAFNLLLSQEKQECWSAEDGKKWKWPNTFWLQTKTEYQARFTLFWYSQLEK